MPRIFSAFSEIGGDVGYCPRVFIILERDTTRLVHLFIRLHYK